MIYFAYNDASFYNAFHADGGLFVYQSVGRAHFDDVSVYFGIAYQGKACHGNAFVANVDIQPFQGV